MVRLTIGLGSVFWEIGSFRHFHMEDYGKVDLEEMRKNGVCHDDPPLTKSTVIHCLGVGICPAVLACVKCVTDAVHLLVC